VVPPPANNDTQRLAAHQSVITQHKVKEQSKISKNDPVVNKTASPVALVHNTSNASAVSQVHNVSNQTALTTVAKQVETKKEEFK
jgi:hypothetical protein